jgi:hypothetical protein
MDIRSASSSVAQRALNLAIMVVKHLFHAAPRTPDSSAARQFEAAKLRVGMRWSVLTTKALSLRSGHKGSVRRGVCPELDYWRTITFYMGRSTRSTRASLTLVSKH